MKYYDVPRPKDQLLLHDGITMSVKRKSHFPERLVRLLITLCGSIGTICCVQGFFHFHIQLFPLLLYIIALTLIMRGIRAFSPKIGFGCILAAFAAIPVLLLRYREQAVVGAGAVYHTMRKQILWKAVFPAGAQQLTGGWTESQCTQFIFILIITAMVALLEYSDVLMTHTQSSKSGFWIRFLVTFPFLECGLYFGIHTSMAAVFLLVLFWIGTLAVSRRKPSRRLLREQGASAPLQQAFLNETEHRFTTHETGAAVLLLGTLLVSFCAFISGAKYDPNSERNKKRLETRQEMREAYRDFSIRDVTGLLQHIPTTMGLNVVTDEIDLMQNADLHFDGRTVLHVSVGSAVPVKDYYMRGIVRSEYTGKGWGIPNGLYRRNQKLFRRLTTANRMPQTMLHSDHADEMRISDGKFPIVSCNVETRVSESVNYLPYEALFKAGTKYRYDIETQLKSYKKYDFSILTNGVTDPVTAWERTAPSPDELISQYESFVDENYTTLPDTPAIQRIYAMYQPDMPAEDAPLPEKLESIRDYLWARAEYTMQPGTQPEDQDFAEYFLTQGHRGYCAHYASSAVILCRMCGIPARYVQGYVLTQNSFHSGNRQPGKDGRSETFEIDIPDYQAHAWAEIYIKGFGWMPYEVTETCQETGHRASQQAAPQTSAVAVTTAAAVTTRTTTVPPTITSAPQTTGQGGGSGRAGRVLKVLGRMILILLAIAAVLYIWYRVHCTVIRRRKQAMHDKQSNEAASASYEFLMKLLHTLGIEQRKMSHETFAAYAEQKCELLQNGKIAKAIEIQQAAVFSRNGVSAADAKILSQTADLLAGAVYQQAGFFRRLWLRWFLHIIQ